MKPTTPQFRTPPTPGQNTMVRGEIILGWSVSVVPAEPVYVPLLSTDGSVLQSPDGSPLALIEVPAP